MTPDDLKQWRDEMGWTRDEAAAALGLGLRGYAYLEQGETSAGTPRQEIPRYIELATAELRRKKGSP